MTTAEMAEAVMAKQAQPQGLQDEWRRDRQRQRRRQMLMRVMPLLALGGGAAAYHNRDKLQELWRSVLDSEAAQQITKDVDADVAAAIDEQAAAGSGPAPATGGALNTAMDWLTDDGSLRSILGFNRPGGAAGDALTALPAGYGAWGLLRRHPERFVDWMASKPMARSDYQSVITRAMRALNQPSGAARRVDSAALQAVRDAISESKQVAVDHATTVRDNASDALAQLRKAYRNPSTTEQLKLDDAQKELNRRIRELERLKRPLGDGGATTADRRLLQQLRGETTADRLKPALRHPVQTIKNVFKRPPASPQKPIGHMAPAQLRRLIENKFLERPPTTGSTGLKTTGKALFALPVIHGASRLAGAFYDEATRDTLERIRNMDPADTAAIFEDLTRRK